MFACACTKTFFKKTTQINPAFYQASPDMIRESEKLKIIKGDHELRNFKLVSYAKFVMVSRDRINFGVALTDKWREQANPCDWKVYVKIDDKQYVPECDSHSVQELTRMFDEQHRRVLVQNQFGDPIRIEGYEQTPTPLTSFTVFKGAAYLTVYGKNILTTETKKIELVLEKNQIRFVFTWNLMKPEKE